MKKVDDFSHARQAIIHPGDPGEPTTGQPRVAIDPLEGWLLAWLAAGRRVLEIGTGLGVSTRALASTAYEVVTVDIDPWVHQVVVPGLPANVQAVMAPDGDDYDLVFIDGSHAYDDVRRDVIAVRDRVRPGGMLVLHDWSHDPVRAAVVAEIPTWPMLHIGSPYGLGIVFRPEKPS